MLLLMWSRFRLAGASTMLVNRLDQTLSIVDLASLEVRQHVIGFNDEIVDLCLIQGSPISDLAVATNSALVKMYSTGSGSVDLLRGHEDIVLCLAASGDGSVLATGSKDRTARIWRRELAEGVPDRRRFACMGICEGHVGSIGAVAVGKTHSNLVVTASQDRTVKVWDLSTEHSTSPDNVDPAKIRSLVTLQVHDKDINAIDITPNDRLLATASQDRSGKIFSLQFFPATSKKPATASLRHLGTLKGHNRGIWTIRFSTHDRCVATGSGDRTIKLWSLADYSCIKTFEGHTNSVLKVDFMTLGTQLASAASDGLVKVWNIKDEQCLTSLDGHDEKVWALAVGEDGSRLISGGADSRINYWQDVTVAEEAERVADQERQLVRTQDYDNFVALRDFRNAITLGLALDNSSRLLTLFRQVADARPAAGAGDARDAESITGLAAVDETIRTLPPADLAKLLRNARDWNALSKTADVAQTLLHAILRFHRVESLLALTDTSAPTTRTGKDATESMTELLEGLVPFTERHLARVKRTAQEASMVKYLSAAMSAYA